MHALHDLHVLFVTFHFNNSGLLLQFRIHSIQFTWISSAVSVIFYPLNISVITHHVFTE